MFEAIAAGLVAFAYVVSIVMIARCVRPDDTAGEA